MASFPDSASDPADQLAEIILDLQQRISALEDRGFRIPTLDADPDPLDSTNLWRFDDGRIRHRGADGVIHEVPARPQIPTFASDPAVSTGWRLWFNGSTGELRGRLANDSVVRFTPVTGGTSGDGGSGGGGTSTKPKPADASPRRYRKVFPATWGRTFCPAHGVELGARLLYGDSGTGVHGERRIMLGFDDATIRTELAGATVRAVELSMLNTDSWAHAGIDVSFGAHALSAPPGAYSAVRRNAFRGWWPESGTGQTWRRIPEWYGRAFKADSIRGLTIDQPSSSTAYYGEIDWSSVRLAFIFTK